MRHHKPTPKPEPRKAAPVRVPHVDPRPAPIKKPFDWVPVIVYGIAMLLIAFIFWTLPARAETACPAGNEETLLTQAITPEYITARNIIVLTGDKVTQYWDNLRNMRFMLGQVSNVDKIYIMDAPAGQDGIVYIFYVNHGCIVDTAVTFKSIIQKLLP